MRLGYFTMPVHPMGRDWSQTLREDREAIILADKLGFYDAFVGEHLTDACENITNSMLFQATLIHDTKTIKLATGTTNLAQMHPVVIAVNAAMFDHLSQGRFIMGISAGALTSDAEAIGILDSGPQQDFRRGDRRHPGRSGNAIRPTTSISPTTGSRSALRAPPRSSSASVFWQNHSRNHGRKSSAQLSRRFRPAWY